MANLHCYGWINFMVPRKSKITVAANSFNPYPGSCGKMPPVQFCLCISKTIIDTAMRF